MVGYFGPPIRLSAVLSGAPHGLEHQSYAPREMSRGLLNADGWGIGWFAPELGPRPGILKGLLPIWADENATTATHAITSRSIVAVVRSATPRQGAGTMNTPPYAWGDRLWAHNGRLWPWPGALVGTLLGRLDPEDAAGLRGTTDSEMLGALWHTRLRFSPTGDAAAALRATLAEAREAAHRLGGGIAANVILADAAGFLAVRFADPGPAPTLYLQERADPEWGGMVVASEPLDGAPGWVAVPPASVVRVDDRGVSIEALS